PDGALYVVDMYRAVIEHPQFMPEELKHRPDLRNGEDRGRVWRITSADNGRPPKPKLSQASTADLVKLLAHTSGWWRDTAARLIYERQDTSIGSALAEMARSGPTPVARVQALWAMQGLGLMDEAKLLTALADASPRVREQAVVLAEPLDQKSVDLQMAVRNLSRDADARLRFQVALSIGGSASEGTAEALAAVAMAGSDDIWTRRAIGTATPENVGATLAVVMRQLTAHPSEGQLLLVEELAKIVGAGRDATSLRALLQTINPDTSTSVPEAMALTLVNGLAQGTRSRGATLLDSVKNKSSDSPDPRKTVEHWFARSADIATDTSRDESARKEACDLLAYAPYDLASPTLVKLLDGDPSQEIRRRALAALSSQRDARVGALVIERLATATPGMRSAMFDALLIDAARINLLLDEIEAGRIRAGELGVLRAGRIVKYRDKKIAHRGAELLASAMPADRTKALADYQAALNLKADAAHGKEVFRRNCSTCHRIGDIGVDVAPSIADTRTKTPEQLLVDILQPSKAIDNNFMSYSVTTNDGQGFTGIIIAETSASVTLKLPEAKTVALLRSDIDELRPNGISLMPDGLEKTISKQEMADVISFVKNWRYLDSGVPAATIPGKNTPGTPASATN
ncbi:MAG TPA: HEAT repeat domain-containing protein, partial [Pirellulales bacterium]|nr:HEAT repeat domain-containing protein [Pirellulales bacterium]